MLIASSATPVRTWATATLRRSLWPSWVWLLIAGVITADVAWLATPYVSLDDQSWKMLIIVWGAAALLTTAAHLAPWSTRAYALITGFSITLSLWPALKILNYITMSYPVPLADERLSSWDRTLGLDWLAYIQWLDQHPIIVAWMSFTYGGLIQYCCIAFLAIIFVKGVERSIDFICMFMISAVVTIMMGPLFPAKGAMIFYAPQPANFEVIQTTMGTYFWPPLSAIRGSSELNLVLTDLPGLVAFPSFHTAMGVLLIYASRGSAVIFMPATAFNLLMIASTPLFGGHYFVDVIAGGVLAAGTVILYEYLKRRGVGLRLAPNKVRQGLRPFYPQWGRLRKGSLVSCATKS